MPTRRRMLTVAPVVLVVGGGLLAWALLRGGDDGRVVTPTGNWSLEEARAFDGFALFWAGDNFGDQPLTAIIRAEGEDSVSFLYGSCTLPEGEGGCAVPFQVTVEPFCQSPPGRLAESVKKGEPFQLRGALAQEYGEGSMQLWTQDVSISLHVEGERGSARTLAEALRPLNSLASPGLDDALPAPHTIEYVGCP